MQIKKSLLQLAVETSSFVPLYVQVSSAYLNPKWIGPLCLCCVAYQSGSRPCVYAVSCTKVDRVPVFMPCRVPKWIGPLCLCRVVYQSG
jgi:hypothetical protein